MGTKIKRNNHHHGLIEYYLRITEAEILKLNKYDGIDDFYGSDHRPVFAEFEIPIEFPDFYQIIRGQFTQDALKNNLRGMMKINKVKVRNINKKYLTEVFDTKIQIPARISGKFGGDFISAENGVTSMDNLIKSIDEFTNGINFSNSDLPAFACIPNTVEWVKRGRMIVIITLKFENLEFDGYANVVLDKIDQKGVGVEIANINAVSRNTRIAVIDLSLTYSDLECEKQKGADNNIAKINEDSNNGMKEENKGESDEQ